MASPSKTRPKFVEISRTVPKFTEDLPLEKSETPFLCGRPFISQVSFSDNFAPRRSSEKAKMQRISLCRAATEDPYGKVAQIGFSETFVAPRMIESQTTGLGCEFYGARRHSSSVSFHFPQLGFAAQPNCGRLSDMDEK
jgi:hypothetical protein